MSTLRDKIIKLGKEQPQLQKHLGPILKAHDQRVAAGPDRLPKYGELYRASIDGGENTLVVRGIFQANKGDSFHVRVLRGEGSDLDENKRGNILWRDDFSYPQYGIKDAILAGRNWRRTPGHRS